MKARRDLIRSRLGSLEAEALLVTAPNNVRYLTGFSGSNGQLLVGSEDVFLTDPRYEEQSAREVPDARREIYAGGGAWAAVARAAESLGAGRVGFEAEHVTVAAAARLREAMPGRVLVETTGVVEDLRRVKDETEIECLRRACSFGDSAFEAILAALREGMTELEIATLLEEAMRRAGSDGPSFDTIVAFGPNAAEPHHRPNDRRLARGDMVKMDFGATFAGYHSDMTRTVAFGSPPNELRRIYDLVRAAQESGVAAVRAGARCSEVDAAAREPLRAAGYDFGHGTGHGVGLDVHEAPSVRKEAADILAPGVAVTVEPGIYLPGIGGVRIEDLVVVRDGGCEILTRSPKDLIEV